jgi:hypothetical protein
MYTIKKCSECRERTDRQAKNHTVITGRIRKVIRKCKHVTAVDAKKTDRHI